MKGKSITGERDREATEKRLLDTIGKMIAEDGFEKIGINAIAAQSGVSKILIYRYFGSVEGLMAAYIRQHDFWLNFPLEYPSREKLAAFVKSMFQGQIEQLRNNPTLKRLYRWELSCKERKRTNRTSPKGNCSNSLYADSINYLSGDAGRFLSGLQWYSSE